MRSTAEIMDECYDLERKGADEYSATEHLPDDEFCVWSTIKSSSDVLSDRLKKAEHTCGSTAVCPI